MPQPPHITGWAPVDHAGSWLRDLRAGAATRQVTTNQPHSLATLAGLADGFGRQEFALPRPRPEIHPEEVGSPARTRGARFSDSAGLEAGYAHPIIRKPLQEMQPGLTPRLSQAVRGRSQSWLISRLCRR